MENIMTVSANRSEVSQGTLAGFSAYLVWGLVPIYWPLLQPAGALEIFGHRIVWSLLFLSLFVIYKGNLAFVWQVIKNKRKIALLAVASVMIASNWALFIWSVVVGRVLDSSLGYYITPLINVSLGVYFLGERLRRLQWIALSIAALGVLYMIIEFGQIPWVALTLAITFGLYGYVKKAADVPAAESLIVETLLMLPWAAWYFWHLTEQGTNTFITQGTTHALMLASAGIITAVPLALYGYAAVRIPLSYIGMLQYVSPTMTFIIGVFINHEPMPQARLIGFAFVWVALIVLSFDMLRHMRTIRTLPLEAS